MAVMATYLGSPRQQFLPFFGSLSPVQPCLPTANKVEISVSRALPLHIDSGRVSCIHHRPLSRVILLPCHAIRRMPPPRPSHAPTQLVCGPRGAAAQRENPVRLLDSDKTQEMARADRVLQGRPQGGWFDALTVGI